MGRITHRHFPWHSPGPSQKVEEAPLLQSKAQNSQDWVSLKVSCLERCFVDSKAFQRGKCSFCQYVLRRWSLDAERLEFCRFRQEYPTSPSSPPARRDHIVVHSSPISNLDNASNQTWLADAYFEGKRSLWVIQGHCRGTLYSERHTPLSTIDRHSLIRPWRPSTQPLGEIDLRHEREIDWSRGTNHHDGWLPTGSCKA